MPMALKKPGLTERCRALYRCAWSIGSPVRWTNSEFSGPDAEREIERGAGRDDAVDAAQPLEQIREGRVHGDVVAESRTLDRHVEYQPAIGDEAGISPPQVVEAANEPARTGDESNREGDLRDRHRRQPARRAAAARRRPAAFVHQRLDVGGGEPQRRSESHEHAAHHERPEREQQDPAVERHGLEARQIRSTDREQSAHERIRRKDADHRAGGREQDRFGEQLPHDPAAPGANRDPHGHLAGARGTARQHQVGHVHAREHQQQSRGRQHDDEDRAQLPDDRLDQRADDVGARPGARRENHAPRPPWLRPARFSRVPSSSPASPA